MSNGEQYSAVESAAEYMRAQHRDDAVMEAKVARRNAQIIGDQAAVEAFEAIVVYLECRSVGKPAHDDDA